MTTYLHAKNESKAKPPSKGWSFFLVLAWVSFFAQVCTIPILTVSTVFGAIGLIAAVIVIDIEVVEDKKLKGTKLKSWANGQRGLGFWKMLVWQPSG